MKVKAFVLMVICLFVWGCPASPPPRTIVTIFFVKGSYDNAWKAVTETFAELNLSVLNMEKESGFVTTDWVSVDNAFYKCGSPGEKTGIIKIRGKLNVFLKKTAYESQEVRINCQYELTVHYPNGLKKYPCTTTGKLESQMFELINSKI